MPGWGTEFWPLPGIFQYNQTKDLRSDILEKQWFLESLGTNGAHLDFVINLVAARTTIW